VAVRQTDLVTPEFAAYTGNRGTKGVRVETAEELEDGPATALDHEGCSDRPCFGRRPKTATRP